MSRTQLLGLTEDLSSYQLIREYHNSHGSAPVIWTILWDKYIRKPTDPYYMGWINSDCKPLWKLYKDERLSLAEKAVLLMTFDHELIARKNAVRAYDDIVEFFKNNHYDGNYVNHWPQIAADIFDARDRDDIAYFGIYHTSVSINPYDGPWNDETENYDAPNRDDFFEIYEELDNLV